MRTRNLTSPSAIIDALGGTAAVARLTGCSLNQVSSWRRPGETFPSNCYLLMMSALGAMNYDASPALWGMKLNAGPRPKRMIRPPEPTAEVA